MYFCHEPHPSEVQGRLSGRDRVWDYHERLTCIVQLINDVLVVLATDTVRSQVAFEPSNRNRGIDSFAVLEYVQFSLYGETNLAVGGHGKTPCTQLDNEHLLPSIDCINLVNCCSRMRSLWIL